MHATFGLASRAKGAEFSLAYLVQNGLRHYRAGGIARAEKQYIVRSISHRASHSLEQPQRQWMQGREIIARREQQPHRKHGGFAAIINRVDILEKVLEKLATSQKTTIVIDREHDGQNASDVRLLGRRKGLRFAIKCWESATSRAGCMWPAMTRARARAYHSHNFTLRLLCKEPGLLAIGDPVWRLSTINSGTPMIWRFPDCGRAWRSGPCSS